MSLSVKVGDVLSMAEAKSGEGSKGPWLFTVKKAEKGYDKITVWVSNPGDVRGAETIEVTGIESVTVRNRKYTDQSGMEKWAKDFQINATAKDAGREQAIIQDAVDDFVQLTEEPDLPFA